MIDQCYVYKWTHLPTMKWYVGSRTRKNSHPNDGYICSSRLIKPLIIKNPHEWARQIIAIGSSDDMYNLETEILQLFDAKNDPKSFNRHNNTLKRFDKTGVKESLYTRKKKSIAHIGKKRPEHAAAMTGRTGYWHNKTRPDQTGEHNPVSKCYIVMPPDSEPYEVWAIKAHAKQMGWPGTFWDIVHGKYIPKKGKLKGYRIIVKNK